MRERTMLSAGRRLGLEIGIVEVLVNDCGFDDDGAVIHQGRNNSVGIELQVLRP
jgi:hypothetical protein